MADVTSQPLVAPPAASLYPQPPQQQQSTLSSNPASMLDIATKLQQLYVQNQNIAAQKAVGAAYQGAWQPDGTLDPEKLRAGLNDPAASWMLPDAVTHVQQHLRTQFDTRHAQDQAVRQVVGNLPPNATDEQLYAAAAQLARLGVPGGLIEGWRSQIPRDPKGRAEAIANIRNMALSPEAVSTPVPGPPGSGGEPTAVSRGTFNRYDAMPGGMPTGLSASQQHSVEHMQRDQAAQANFSQEQFRWRQALDAVEAYKKGGGSFGPGQNDWNNWVSFVQSKAPGVTSTLGFDPTQVKNFNEAKKYTMAAIMFSRQGVHPTDAQLDHAVSSMPNVSVDDLALDDLIKSQMASSRAEYAVVNQAAKANGPNYSAEKARLATQYDINAFRHDLLSPEERSAHYNAMPPGSAAANRYNLSLEAAYDSGAMDRPVRAAPAAPAPAPVTTPPATPVTPASPRPSRRPAPGFFSSSPAASPAAPAAAPPDFAARDAALMADARARAAAGIQPPAAAAAGPSAAALHAAYQSAPMAATPGEVPADFGDRFGAAYGARPAAAPAPGPSTPVTLPTPPVHTVARGQTLEQIANKYGMTPREIAISNGLEPDKIRPGTRLTIPPPHPAAQWGRLPNGRMGWVVQHDGRWHQYIRGE